MRSVLSSKVKEGKLVVLEDFTLKSNKTSSLKAKLLKLPMGKSVLFVSGDKVDENFSKALRNIPNYDVLPSIGANVYDILKKDTLVLSKSSVSILVKRLSNQKDKIQTIKVKEKK